MIQSKSNYIMLNFVPESIQSQLMDLRKTCNILPYQGGKSPDDIITLNTGHITMKRAFYLRNSITESDLLNLISSLSFKPIHIRISSLDMFESPELGNVLVGVVDKNEELLQLHLAIYEYLDGNIEEKYTKYQRTHFTPHVSFIYELSDEQKATAIREAKKIMPLEYTLDTVQLLKSNLEFERTRNIVKEFYASN